MKFFTGRITGSFALALVSGPAFAHHAMDDELPATLWEGLISGLAHPVIGIDHLAFIVAAGVIAAIARLGVWTPVVFVAASLAGVGVHLAEIDLPAVEILIALSVLVAGVALAASRTGHSLAVWMAGFAVAGLLHGYAYGESIVGAEQTPLVAYLLGLGIVQAAIAVGVAAFASGRGWFPEAVQPRLVGAAAFGVGLSALAGNILG